MSIYKTPTQTVKAYMHEQLHAQRSWSQNTQKRNATKDKDSNNNGKRRSVCLVFAAYFIPTVAVTGCRSLGLATALPALVLAPLKVSDAV